jgi:Mitochondrial carrier protein
MGVGTELEFGFVNSQIRRKLFAIVGEEGNAVSVLGANFSAAFVAGSLAAAATCPLDVAKTRRQIEVSFLYFLFIDLYAMDK